MDNTALNNNKMISDKRHIATNQFGWVDFTNTRKTLEVKYMLLGFSIVLKRFIYKVYNLFYTGLKKICMVLIYNKD